MSGQGRFQNNNNPDGRWIYCGGRGSGKGAGRSNKGKTTTKPSAKTRKTY